MLVPRWGFEPQSSEPESDILSIELPGLFICLLMPYLIFFAKQINSHVLTKIPSMLFN